MPSIKINMSKELARFDITEPKSINKKLFKKMYSNDRSLENLSHSLLISAKTGSQIKFAKKVHEYWVKEHHERHGFDWDITFEDDWISKVDNKDCDINDDFTPSIPASWKYSDKFNSKYNDYHERERALFKLEWGMLRADRLPHHSTHITELPDDIIKVIKDNSDIYALIVENKLDDDLL